MTAPALSEDIALRIGLAARLLPDSSPAQVLQVLADSIGLPPSEAGLATLKVKDLATAANGLLGDCDRTLLKDVLALLKGEIGEECVPPPPLDPYRDGDLPGSIRVACASNNGELLDGHFGACRRFLIYQVAAGETRLIDCRECDEPPAGADRNATRADLLVDCQLLYVRSIGGPAAAKVVKRGIHPVTIPDAGDARARMQELQAIVGGAAPPWLAKVMGLAPEERARFARAEADTTVDS